MEKTAFGETRGAQWRGASFTGCLLGTTFGLWGGQAPSQLHRPRGASGESLQRPLLEVAVMRLSLCRGQ